MKRALPVVISLVLVLASCTAAPSPTLIAHRGGASVYPESSAEAIEAVSQTDFPIEIDLRSLEDGTLVPLHDDTVDRTMIGITGKPQDISRDQWGQAAIHHPGGGEPGTPTTWERIADTYGQDHVLVPEIKDSGVDLDNFVRSVTSRGIQGNVIVQSFDYSIVKRLVARGLNALYLVHSDESVDPAEVADDGIAFIGPNKGTSAARIAEMKDAGLTVWVWTVNDANVAATLVESGADGLFTDDPWKLAEALW